MTIRDRKSLSPTGRTVLFEKVLGNFEKARWTHYRAGIGCGCTPLDTEEPGYPLPGIHRGERYPRTNGPHECIANSGWQNPLPVNRSCICHDFWSASGERKTGTPLAILVARRTLSSDRRANPGRDPSKSGRRRVFVSSLMEMVIAGSLELQAPILHQLVLSVNSKLGLIIHTKSPNGAVAWHAINDIIIANVKVGSPSEGP